MVGGAAACPLRLLCFQTWFTFLQSPDEYTVPDCRNNHRVHRKIREIIVVSIFQAGLTGFERGMQGVQKAAGEIASASHSNLESSEKPVKEIAESLIDAKISARQAEASVAVIKAGDEAIGSILDVIA